MGDETNSKLIEAKRAWARQGRLLTGTTADPARDRLPPGQKPVVAERDWQRDKARLMRQRG